MIVLIARHTFFYCHTGIGIFILSVCSLVDFDIGDNRRRFRIFEMDSELVGLYG
jgi:hypothetical protein